ncbi:MAG: S-layer homology domain-containing protein [Acidimicrobiales bacterium]|nr:S-layer homology domain-containing protein [Acidimicrobiales bacterium]
MGGTGSFPMRPCRLSPTAVLFIVLSCALWYPSMEDASAALRPETVSCDDPPPSGYPDVGADTPMAAAIDWATCHRVIGAAPGRAGGAFAPTERVQRGTLLRALWVLSGRPAPFGPGEAFDDVPASSLLRRPLDWATSIGIVHGGPGRTFRPRDGATRSSLVTWAFRALSGGDVPSSATTLPVTDVRAGSARHTAVAWAHAAGLVHLTSDGRFRSTAPASRAAAAKFLWRAAGTPAAWEQTFAGAALLATADGWWDTAAWDGTGGVVPDLSGGDHPLSLAAGKVGPPVVLGLEADRRPFLFHPGWDDMILDTPDNDRLPTGDFEFRLDADLTPELQTSPSPDNVVFHQGGTGNDASLAVSYHRETGAPTVWWSSDGVAWHSETGPPPSVGVGAGRRGVRFVADDGAGGHRIEFYEQDGGRATEDLLLAFDDPAWQPAGSVTQPGLVTIHDSTREVAMSSGDDQVGGRLAWGWGRIRRMALTTPAGRAFDLDPSTIDLPLTWSRSGPIPGTQHCWCMPDDTGGPAKDGSFTDATGATWTIHNWQTGSAPIALVDRPSILLGNGARLTSEPTDAFAPGPDGLTVVLGFRWTRSGISGAFLASQRPGTLNHDLPGWSMLVTGFLCCGPAFVVSDEAETTAARSPAEPDGDATTAIGVLDRVAGTVRSFSAGIPGTAETATPDAARTITAEAFTVGGDLDASLHSYGGFEFFGAAVFRRPLSDAEVAAVDAYLTDADRRAEVTVPAPVRFA